MSYDWRMRLLWCVVMLLLPAIVQAQPDLQPSGHGFTIEMEPAEKDTFACRWDRTMSSGAVTVTLLQPPAQADGTPSNIVTAGPTASGSTVSVTLSPDQGCGAVGCRNGNQYQLKLKATDSNGNTPTCNLLLRVREVTLVP